MRPADERPALDRRTLLRHGVTAALAVPLLGTAPAAAQPYRRPADPPLDVVRQRLLAEVPAYDRPGHPRGVVLSFTDDPATTRTATWLTSDVDPGTVVQWGVVGADATPEEVRPDHLDRTAAGTAQRAPYGDGDVSNPLQPIRDEGPDVHPGERPVWVHRATMTDLPAGRRIAYRVGDGRRWSPIQLTGGPSPVDGGMRFTHVGDHGCRLASQRISRAIAEQQPDWHLFAGDISYANGDQRVWDLWSQLYQPTGATVPTMASPGNHEAKDFMGQTYRTRLSHPNPGRSYYAVEIGNVLLVSTPAGAFFGDIAGALEDIQAELLWMEQVLATGAARRAAGLIDFIVVTQHFPSFTHHQTRGPISADRVLAAEQTLQRYQIDLLLVGHDHMYQRSYPMVFGVPTSGLLPTGQPETFRNATGYIEVIAGAGGQSLYDFTEVDTLELDPTAVHPDAPLQRQLPWLAAGMRELSFVRYDVQGPVMEVTAFAWDDGHDANTGDGVIDNEVPYDGDDPMYATYRSPDLVIDRFRLERKAFAAEVPTVARPAAEVLADVPEALGHLVYNATEDCTRHGH